ADVESLPTPDWSAIALPDTWVDRLNPANPLHLLKIISRMCGKHRAVEIPIELPGRDRIPKYLLQEFHGLPNGNYSKRITRGYLTGFDRTMLGSMGDGRQRIAAQLAGCCRVLDAGCGGGRTARALKDNGIGEVWGLDPSPYLLQHAANDHPGIRFVQGIAEATDFESQYFDGIAVCFLLHELPPRYMQRALAEFNRILKPGGRVAICEPSPLQLRLNAWQLFRRFGLKGVYFRCLARTLHEPFVDAWHRTDATALFQRYGFEVIEENAAMPLRHFLLRKIHTLQETV